MLIKDLDSQSEEFVLFLQGKEKQKISLRWEWWSSG